MGGINSGRRRETNRGAVEEHIRLEIRALRGSGGLTAGACNSVFSQWLWSAGGDERACAFIHVDLTAARRASATIRFRFNGEWWRQVIPLVNRPTRFGGERWFFVCPTGRHCEALFLADGVFASRQAHLLTYRSQSMGELARLRQRKLKLERRLRPEDPRRRPRGQNRLRLAEIHMHASDAYNRAFEREAARWLDSRT
ncbi:MAG: hypothetical protein ACRED9_07995 [Caulobacteraceae bacterium]